MKDLRKVVLGIDYILFIVVIFLTILGILFIHSANYNKEGYLRTEYIKQIVFFVVSLIIFFLIIFVETGDIKDFTEILYIISIIGLLLTFLFPEVKGQRRFQLFGVSIQFSEFLKIAVSMYLSKFYLDNKAKIKSLEVFIKGFLLTFIPVGIVLILPDLGSSLVFIPIFFVISLVAGVRKRFLLFFLLLIVFVSFIPVITTINHLYFNNENEIIYLFTNYKYVLLVFAFLIFTLVISLLAYFDVFKGVSYNFKVFFYWYIFVVSAFIIGLSFSYPVNKVLKDYQKDRLLIFFNPYIDPKGRGYNIIQSLTSIGNGGLFGKGYMKGEMIQNMFLPEQATDFIFPVLAEELGFIGTFLLLFLYFIYFNRSFKITLRLKDNWAIFTSAGLLSILIFHIFQNIGMCISIMPITGIPLPFISYGGSFLISCYMITAMLMNFSMNR